MERYLFLLTAVNRRIVNVLDVQVLQLFKSIEDRQSGHKCLGHIEVRPVSLLLQLIRDLEKMPAPKYIPGVTFFCYVIHVYCVDVDSTETQLGCDGGCHGQS